MPESAGGECNQAGTETGFLAAGSDAKIDIIAQPVVGVHVPAAQVRAWVLSSLDGDGVNVLQSVPRNLACHWVYSVVTQTGENTGAFRQCPDAIILEACDETSHVEDEDSAENAILHVRLANKFLVIETAREIHKRGNPTQTGDGLDHGRGAASGNLALLADRRFFGRIDTGRDLEHGGINPAAVVNVVKCGTGH